MPELTPVSFARLLHRMLTEYRREAKIYDMPAAKFWKGPSQQLFSTGVRFHGLPAGSPLGPAAGPQTQMAQNIVLSWLGGCRIIELKTVQIDDRLTIGRPCIDATNVGYNIEFSQELLLEQSLEEYVKAWMLIRILEEEEILGVPKRTCQTGPETLAHFYDTVFDLSCGYNLEGIRSEKVQAFIRGMLDASAIIEKLRAEIPDEYAHLKAIDYNPHIVKTATLSTFHGCPADEIEKIVDFLLRENHLHTIIKMNPTMLGEVVLNHILHQTLGYTELQINPTALTSGLHFDESIGITRRLRQTAHSLNLRVGAKFNNTLEVVNHLTFFQPVEKVMYMSGAPLHPIGVELALRFRQSFLEYVNGLSTDVREIEEDGHVPLSFSAGVDKTNFPMCVACGFVPITTCTDLLKPGGYGRLIDYMKSLEAAMIKIGVTTIDEFVLKWGETGDPGTSTQSAELKAHAALANHHIIAQQTLNDSRYSRARNAVIPKRISSHLTVFDCITCDKCIPVCPNDANFTYQSPELNVTYRNYTCLQGKLLALDEEKSLRLQKSRQIANYAAFCNECGNCDTFCPEYGGPFIEKPTFFSDYKQWQEFRTFDGFHILSDAGKETILGRIKGVDYALIRAVPDSSVTDSSVLQEQFTCPAGSFHIDPVKLQPQDVISSGNGETLIDMGVYLTLRVLLQGVLHDTKVNYVNCMQISHSEH